MTTNICTNKSLCIVTLGGAYDGGGASPANLQGHVNSLQCRAVGL